jgi:Flp pilus assembly protein TadD
MGYQKSAGLAGGLILAGLLALHGPAAAAPVSDEALAQIQSAIDDQRYLDAGSMIEQQSMNAGDDPRLLTMIGNLSLVRGRYEEALASFKRVERVASVRAQAMEGEGIALSVLGRSDEALAALKAAVTQNPVAWRAWNVLGSEYDRRHDWSQAEDAYDRAISASTGSAVVFNNRGFSRLSQHRLEDAIGDFVSALQKKPDMVQARNNLRLAIAMKGEYSRALAGAGRSDQAAILNNAGYAAMLRGDYDNAKDLLQRAMKAKGDYYSLAAENLEMTENLAKGFGSEHAPGH